MTTVSVVVPTRNRSALLAMTVHSVLWQRDVDLDLIVVDDASTDDTADVLAGFRDARLRTVRHATTRGPAAARNAGAAVARGEWVGFVDDDDLWAPDKLAAQVAAARTAGRRWAFAGAVTIVGGFEIVGGTPPPSAEQALEALPRYNAIPGGGSNVIVERGLLQESGGFDERIVPCEDWELSIRLARAGMPAVVSVPVVAYRLHGGNASLDVERIRRAAKLIEGLHATRVDWGRLHRWMAESCLRFEQPVQAAGHFFMAAANGQATGVMSDVRDILLRRLAGGRPSPGESGVGRDSWRAPAEAWLRDLQRLLPASPARKVGNSN